MSAGSDAARLIALAITDHPEGSFLGNVVGIPSGGKVGDYARDTQNNCLYVCVSTNTFVAIGSLAMPAPLWMSGLTYQIGAHVAGSDGKTYVGKVANNKGINPTTDAAVHWQNLY